MALRRLKSVESKMNRDAAYAKLYNDHIAGYVEKGYARKLSPIEAATHTPRSWYLPHFGVQNPNKPGKFRLVFDAAAAIDGVSLNSMLLKGPDQNQPLTLILFRFRLGVVGICGDIREMFHQVRIRESDHDSQRFLWRHGNAAARPDVYVMTAMTFGATCSPASAQFVKNRNAADFQAQHPDAAEAITMRHYVDDYVASFADESEAIETTKAVIEVHRRGGFELRGFVSNHSAVLISIGAEGPHEQTITLPSESGSSSKVLGMRWDTREDVFLFTMDFSRVSRDVISGNRPPTKRELLSVAMSVFDPFGILADFMVHAKLLVQELWQQGVEWDDPIPQPVAVKWDAWRAEVERTKLCRVPRCYSAHIRVAQEIQLHTFADASESAFVAVAYWRVTYGGRHEAFIAGKTKCAPLKMLSVPRLELQAAVLATRLQKTIRESHDIDITRTVMWTDSRTVVSWLQSRRRRFQPFVAHRVAEVLESAPSSWWRWLPTSENVADDATRARFPPKFNPTSRWLQGPAFLKSDATSWPGSSDIVEDEEAGKEEIRSKFVGAQLKREIILDLNRFCRLDTLLRTIGWVRRFMANTQSKVGDRDPMRGELTVGEMDGATKLLCRMAQEEDRPEEYNALCAGMKIDRASPLRNLMLYRDDDNLLRLFGRIDAANTEHLPEDMKRPIFLPKTHRLTLLIVEHFHRLMRHTNEDATIGAVRCRYWVPHLRMLVRRARRNCMFCRIRAAMPVPPILGQLPKYRITPYVRPFQNTGLDYFGPVHVSVGRRRKKRWVALFTCLAVRAVHLEIAADLSTDACLVAIRNFCNLRGTPSRIRCDNGTNFVGASNVMKRTSDIIDGEAIRASLAGKNIEWLFNCPGNPEAGGAWERMVQSVKRVLAVTLNEIAPRVETLRSLLLEAANIVNARPLTHVPVSPMDEEPLTPNHFLVGHSNSTIVPVPIDARAMSMRKQWRISQQLTNRYWVRWLREYLPELTRRTKHHQDVAPLKVGDLVLICDSNQARSQWRRGRVQSVITGTDGHVRTAEVKTAQGTVRRPTARLAILDVKACESPMESTHGGRDVTE